MLPRNTNKVVRTFDYLKALRVGSSFAELAGWNAKRKDPESQVIPFAFCHTFGEYIMANILSHSVFLFLRVFKPVEDISKL